MRLAVPLLASTVPVVPGAPPLQAKPTHLPPPCTEKVVPAVASPSGLPKTSSPCAENDWIWEGAAGSRWYCACGGGASSGGVGDTVAARRRERRQAPRSLASR